MILFLSRNMGQFCQFFWSAYNSFCLQIFKSIKYSSFINSQRSYIILNSEMTEVVTTNNALTKALVISKTKCDNLENIKNLNLWGNELEDLKLLRQMPNLEVVSLSVNCISTLKEFSYCTKLQQLYLRKNNIQDIRQIKYLLKLQSLKVLWLHDNPCSNIPNYREIVIKMLPRLTKLDNSSITNEERVLAQKIPFSLGEFQEQQSLLSNRNQRENQKPMLSSHEVLSEKRIISNRENKQMKCTSQKQKNILSAVFSLYKELDENSLQIAKIQCERLLALRRK